MKRIMAGILTWLCVVAFCAALSLSIGAQQTTTKYTYDSNGRLTSVTLPSGLVVVYKYDATGNLVSVTQQNAPLPTISAFTPSIGPPLTSVAITGTGFDPAAANNQVGFNGATITATSATPTTINAAVPNRATSGHITVTTPAGSVTSTADFFVPPFSFAASDVAFADRMVIGGSKTVTISAPNKIAIVIFDGAVGQRVSLNMTGVTVPVSTAFIQNPDGTALSPTATVRPPGGFIDTLSLPVTGTYSIIVIPQVSGTGSLTLTLNNVVDATGSITIGGPAVQAVISTPGQNSRLTFTGSAGQRVFLLVTNLTIQNSQITIINPDGSKLASRTATPSDLIGVYIDTTVLPATGTYTILIDPIGSSTGILTLTLYNVPPDVTGTITPGGPSVTVSIGSIGQNASLTFDETAGHRVSIIGSNFPNVILSPFLVGFASVNIVAPDGTQLPGGQFFGGGRTFIDATLLPATGTYTITINPAFTLTGSITLALYDVPPDVTGVITPTQAGSSVSFALTAPGQEALYTFSGTAGQRITLIMSGTFQAVSVTLITPTGGTQVAGGTVILPTTGTYKISIDPLTFTGSATLTLYDVAPDITGSLTIGGAPVSFTITTPGQNATLTFNGTAGTPITVNITNNNISFLNAVLSDSAGNDLSDCFDCAGSFNLRSVTLPATGTFQLFLAPLVGSNVVSTGTITVTVTSP
jgi:YD repeat-containing protein